MIDLQDFYLQQELFYFRTHQTRPYKRNNIPLMIKYISVQINYYKDDGLIYRFFGIKIA